MTEFLMTAEFGEIRIVDKEPSMMFDTYIRNDTIDEWEYWQLCSGEIVAYRIGEDEE
jgi:hypothetical protein